MGLVVANKQPCARMVTAFFTGSNSPFALSKVEGGMGDVAKYLMNGCTGRPSIDVARGERGWW